MRTALFTKPIAGKLNPARKVPGRPAFVIAEMKTRKQVDDSFRDLQWRRALREEAGRASK